MFTNQNNNQKHDYFMRLALQQATRTLGNTKENPAVGCVVTKDNHVISAESTSISGRPHAERNALNFLKKTPKNCFLYVTLEPCSHYGKTPPCINTIIKKKIKKVFFSIKDPDSRSYSKCSKKLKKAGISVSEGVFKNKIKFFYRSYINFKNRNLPYVTCKIAISKDFYTINKKSKWITNEFSRGRVHLMRSSHDCIITSSKSIIKDNPQLTCRINGLTSRSPTRIVLDNELKIGMNSNIIKGSSVYRTIIFYNKTNKKKIGLLKKFKVKAYKVTLDNEGNIDLIKTLIKIRELGFSRVFLETGIKLAANFLNKNLVDYLKVFVSSQNLGKNGDRNCKKYLKTFLKNKKGQIEKVNLLGDKLISYKLK